MNDRQIKSFLAMAEIGSINTAARSLYVTPSALVKQLNGMEEELGVPLFVRGKKGVHLTRAGSVYYEGMKKLSQSYDELLANTLAAAVPEKETVVIGSWGVGVYSVLPRLSSYFSIRCPEIRLVFKTISSISAMQEALENREIDLTLSFGGIGEATSRLRYVSIAAEPCAFLVPVSCDLREKKVLSFRDFENRTLVTTEGRLSGWFHRINHYIRKTYPSIRLYEVAELNPGLMYMQTLSSPCLGCPSIFTSDSNYTVIPFAPADGEEIPPLSIDLLCRPEPDPTVEKLIQYSREAARLMWP